jgi:Uma2 family endonuclease
MALRTILTYEDYAALPADGRRYEIHEGELSVTPAPGTRHQEVGTVLIATLWHHVRARRLGKLFADPRSETIEAYVLTDGAYRLAARLEGSQPVALRPFPDRLLDPAVIWA